jgi:BlaR1 peptidase M56
MIGALAATVAAGIVLPHLLHLQRVEPVTAIILCLGSLALRALAAVLGVVYLLFFLPGTSVFDALTHWCLHAVLPFATELSIEGHGAGDLALLVPGAALAGSLLWICVLTARRARATRRLIDRHVVGRGPRNSLMVGGPEVMFAVAGIARPQIVVSAGALASLDDAELDAALDHEQAHIARRHRFLMLLAIVFQALGRPVPGTRHAIRGLAFHLERDADDWALRRRNDRLALASAICKAAGAIDSPGHPGVAQLGETGVRERLGQLLQEPPSRRSLPGAAALNGLAAAMVVCTLLLAAVVPAAAVAGVGGDAHRTHHDQHCVH